MNCLGASVGNQLTVNMRGYFWTFSFIPIYLCLSLWSVPHCLDYGSLMIKFTIRKCKPPNCVLFFQVVLAMLGSLYFCVNISWSISAKSLLGFLCVCVLWNLLISLEDNCQLNNIKFSSKTFIVLALFD